MTTPHLATDIGHDEGCRLHAYPDPDSPRAQALDKPEAERPADWDTLSGAPWTIGYGCTGPEIGPQTVWTQAEADEALARRLIQVQRQLDLALPWWRTALNDARQDVFVGLAYNLGLSGFLKFERFIAACRVGRWAAAELDLVGSPSHPSRWARQVKTRGVRLGRQIRTGERAAP
jgi:GH24 family phage-related lysozyme (muramidase)